MVKTASHPSGDHCCRLPLKAGLHGHLQFSWHERAVPLAELFCCPHSFGTLPSSFSFPYIVVFSLLHTAILSSVTRDMLMGGIRWADYILIRFTAVLREKYNNCDVLSFIALITFITVVIRNKH